MTVIQLSLTGMAETISGGGLVPRCNRNGKQTQIPNQDEILAG